MGHVTHQHSSWLVLSVQKIWGGGVLKLFSTLQFTVHRNTVLMGI